MGIVKNDTAGNQGPHRVSDIGDLDFLLKSSEGQGEEATSGTITIREIVRSVDLTEINLTWAEAVEHATVLAMQLGYRVAAGTGGAYADHGVTAENGEIIKDILVNTDSLTGEYTGDLCKIADLAMVPEAHKHNMEEVALTLECEYGCKILACDCGEQVVSHRRIYGCPQGV